MKLSISILCDNFVYAKQISDQIRELGHIPYVFDQREQFWNENLVKPSNLAIVFVKDLVDMPGMNLHQHPAYQKGHMNYVFFSDRDHLSLLKGAFEYFCYGTFILENGGLKEKFQSYIQKCELNFRYQRENSKLKKKVYDQQNKIEALASEKQEDLRSADFRAFLREIVDKIANKMKTRDFFEAFCDVMEANEYVENFAFVEPTIDGNKVVSPYYPGLKYKVLPSCFVGGERCKSGIENLGTSLSYQMACDFFERDFVTLSLRLNPNDRAFAIVYLQVPQELIEEFDWDLFTSLLSGFYSKSLLSKARHQVTDKSYHSPWGLLTLMQEKRTNLENHRVYFLDLEKLINVANRYPTAGFQWGVFEDHFKSSLHARIDMKYDAALYEAMGFVYLIAEEQAEVFEDHLSKLSKTFSYWRYFENSDLILSESLTPRIRVLRSHFSTIRNFLNQQQAKVLGKVTVAPEVNKLRTIVSNEHRPLIEN